MLKRNLKHDTFEKILRTELVDDEVKTKPAEELFGRIKGKLKVKSDEK